MSSIEFTINFTQLLNGALAIGQRYLILNKMVDRGQSKNSISKACIGKTTKMH